MSFTHGEIDMLICPRCRGPLREADAGLECGRCGASYRIRDGVPDLLPWSGGEPGREWTRWREKLELLQQWRHATWDDGERAESCQELADDLAARFFEFVRPNESDSVLEIGCGNGDLRRYLPRQRYWGLDPLFPAPQGSGAAFFVRGVGECLPLADTSFDAVVLCQTLDHCLDPARVIREANRVLKPGGLLGILQGLHVAAPAAARARAAAGKLKSRLLGRWRPGDADTKTNFLGRDELTALVEAELTVEADRTCGSVLFLRARRREGPMPPSRRREGRP